MGIFDAEGCVHRDRHRISIAQSTRDFLIDIQRMFKECDLNFLGPTLHTTKLGEWYTIRLGSEQEFVKFSKIIDSAHVKKRFLLKVWLKEIRTRKHLGLLVK